MIELLRWKRLNDFVTLPSGANANGGGDGGDGEDGEDAEIDEEEDDD